MSSAAATFFDVEIRSMTAEATGVLSLSLRDPAGADLPEWEPGAHVDLVLPGGEIRQYSLCSDPAVRGEWRLGVLRETAGRGGSAYVHEQLRPGQVLRARTTRNTFALAPAPRYTFVAGGIGITPILPMLRAANGAGVPWRLVYLGRSQRSMAFTSEALELASAQGLGELLLHAREAGSRFALAELLAALDDAEHLYACGPAGLLRDLEEHAAGWADPSRYHWERFESDPQAGATESGAGDASATGDSATASFVVETNDGAEIEVPADLSILEALERAGRFPLSSCREGICGTCETPVRSGEIEHRDSLLSEEERAAGDTMMICVSRCRGGRLLLDL